MFFPRFSPLLLTIFLLPWQAQAAQPLNAGVLAPHKAVYDIDLIATHSGSQIINISGQLSYEWKPACEAYLTNHKFTLMYEYADSPGMKIASNFTTFESGDGRDFDYSSRRDRDGSLYQEIRGHATTGKKAAGKAVYSKPENLKYDLPEGTLFPVSHTLGLIEHARAGEKFYPAVIFDGSDEDGPIEINSFIGKEVKDAGKTMPKSDKIDSKLLNGRAWNVRMAVFPVKDQEEESDYEMSLVFHENGIISDMEIDYDDFSVRQKLVSLESLPADSCGSSKVEEKPVPKKP